MEIGDFAIRYADIASSRFQDSRVFLPTTHLQTHSAGNLSLEPELKGDVSRGT